MSIIHDALKKAEKDRQSETDKGSVSSLPTFLKKKSSFVENKRKLIAISSSVLVFIAVIFFIFSGSKKEKSQDTTISQKIDRENLPQTSVNVEEGKIEKDSSDFSPKIENIMEDLGKKIIQQRKNPESP